MAELLREHPSTSVLSSEHLEMLAGCATTQTLTQRHYLWRQGERSETLYLIQSGQVALEISLPGLGPLRIEILEAGEILGYSNLLRSTRYQFDARALTAVGCIVFEGHHLQQLMDRNHDLGYALLRRLAPMMAHKLETARLKLFEGNGLDRLRVSGANRPGSQ